MKIYTKTGDKGQTSLLKGGRVSKSSARVEAYGTLDELNSWVGYVRSINTDAEVEAVLARIQPKIHTLCSDVAAEFDEEPEQFAIPRMTEEDVLELERDIDRMDEDLEKLTHFILPSGCPAGAALHIARTICRRGERRLVELIDEVGKVNSFAVKFTNRLSDHLFTLARWANHRANHPETPWKST